MKIYCIPVYIFFFLSFLSAGSSNNTSASVKEVLTSVGAEHIHIGSFAGEKINLCIAERVVKQDVPHLIEPFHHRTETRLWQSEFWGKWMLSAVEAWKYTHDSELMDMMKGAVAGLLETQTPDGYIGNYAPENQLAHWDIWGRKYSMLGLMSYYEITNDRNALAAAGKVADHLMSQVGHEAANIVTTGNYRGMASSSVLEPIVYLYKHTGEQRYLDFANYIVKQWETQDGPQLLSKALNGIAVSERFPRPASWWSYENGQKAYEMMSCYEGLLQLYLVTGIEEYRKAVELVVDNVIESEINIAGSGSAFECWYHGIENQTRPTYHTMETCVTTTWMKLCNSMLQLTGDSKYADQIELTFYNALLASMKDDGSEIAKYSPLEGRRHAGEEQCNMHINCCNANGPRGFGMIPDYALMTSGNSVYINFYGEMEATVKLPGGNEVMVRQISTYPETDKVIITVEPEKSAEFEIALRIPEWSSQTSVKINGESTDNFLPGNYLTIARKWNQGDQIELTLDMRGRIIAQDDFRAVMRGPVVLARDSRFGDGFVDEAAVIQQQDGYVTLTPVANKPDNIWLAFTLPVVIGTDLEGEYRKPANVSFCDFASAGNNWLPDSRYKVWIRETLNAMHGKYTGY